MNPTSPSPLPPPGGQDPKIGFFDKFNRLDKPQKIKVLAISIVVGIITLPTLGLGGAVAFFTASHFLHKNANAAKTAAKANTVANTTLGTSVKESTQLPSNPSNSSPPTSASSSSAAAAAAAAAAVAPSPKLSLEQMEKKFNDALNARMKSDLEKANLQIKMEERGDRIVAKLEKLNPKIKGDPKSQLSLVNHLRLSGFEFEEDEFLITPELFKMFIEQTPTVEVPKGQDDDFEDDEFAAGEPSEPLVTEVAENAQSENVQAPLASDEALSSSSLEAAASSAAAASTSEASTAADISTFAPAQPAVILEIKKDAAGDQALIESAVQKIKDLQVKLNYDPNDWLIMRPEDDKVILYYVPQSMKDILNTMIVQESPDKALFRLEFRIEQGSNIPPERINSIKEAILKEVTTDAIQPTASAAAAVAGPPPEPTLEQMAKELNDVVNLVLKALNPRHENVNFGFELEEDKGQILIKLPTDNINWQESLKAEKFLINNKFNIKLDTIISHTVVFSGSKEAFNKLMQLKTSLEKPSQLDTNTVEISSSTENSITYDNQKTITLSFEVPFGQFVSDKDAKELFKAQLPQLREENPGYDVVDHQKISKIMTKNNSIKYSYSFQFSLPETKSKSSAAAAAVAAKEPKEPPKPSKIQVEFKNLLIQKMREKFGENIDENFEITYVDIQIKNNKLQYSIHVEKKDGSQFTILDYMKHENKSALFQLDKVLREFGIYSGQHNVGVYKGTADLKKAPPEILQVVRLLDPNFQLPQKGQSTQTNKPSSTGAALETTQPKSTPQANANKPAEATPKPKQAPATKAPTPPRPSKINPPPKP